MKINLLKNRLELTGYVPPPPASVAAYAGNNCNLISWPVTPGATSYNILRSTTSGSGYVSITNGVVGPVCGSGWNNATYLDAGAVNGTAYYYVVQSANPDGASTNSPAKFRRNSVRRVVNERARRARRPCCDQYCDIKASRSTGQLRPARTSTPSIVPLWWTRSAARQTL